MRQLAADIRKNINQLVDQYDMRLRDRPGYSKIPEATRRDLERSFLNLIIQSLETGDYSLLVQYAQQRANEWAARGLNLTWFQQALIIPEELLVPLVTSVETSNFVWQAMNRSQSVVWQMIAERAHQTEERFRSIVETSHSGILIANDAFQLTYVNDELMQISGYSREELLGVDFRRLLDEESQRTVADHYIRRQRGEDVAPRYEVTFLRKDGTKRYIEMSAVALKDFDGKPYTVAQVLDVSERKQAEQALRASQTQYQTVFDSTPIMFWLKDAQNRTLRINNAAALFEGVQPSAVEGKSCYDIYPPEQAEAFYQDDLQVIRSGQPKSGIIEQHTSVGTGKVMWVETGKVPVRDENGAISGVLAFAVDITARRETEEALRENESKLRAIYEGSNDAIMLLNARGFFDCNSHTLSLFGVDSKEAFIHLHPSELSPAYQPDGQDSLTASQHAIEIAYQQGHHRFEWVHCRITGEEFPAEVLLSAFEYGGEQVLQATVRDITERKQAEALLARERNLLRTLIDTLPDQVFVKDTEGRIILYNQADARAMGLTSTEEALGKTVYDFYPPELADAYFADDLTVIESRQPLIDREERGLTEDGQERWVLTSKVPLNDQAGRPLGLVGVSRDITHRKQIEWTLQESEERFRRFSEATTEGLTFHDQGVILDANPAIIALFGFTSAEELIGRNLLEFVTPESRPLILQKMQLDDVHPYEIECVRKDGTLFPAETSTRTYQHGERKIRATAVRDITIRKQAEEALARSAEKQRQLIQRLRATIEASDELMSASDLNTLYRRAVELAREKLGVERCGLFIVDPSQQFVVGTYGTDDHGHTTDESVVREPVAAHQSVFTSQEKVWIVREASQTHWSEGVQQTVGTGWVAGIAIRSTSGPIGVMYNDTAISRAPLDPDVQETLAVYCSILGNVIERKRLELRIRESLERRSIQVQTTVEVAQHVAAAPEIDELFHRVVTLIKERFNYYHAQLFRYVPADDTVQLITGYGEVGQRMLAAGHKLAMGRGVVGTAAATGRSILATDVTRDRDWQPNPNLPATQGELAVPIKLSGGDAESQLQALKHFINSRYDGFAVAAIDPQAAASITREALQRDKPVVAITNDLGHDNQTALIFAVEHELGQLLGIQAGMWAQQHLPSDQPVKVGLLTYQSLANVVQRANGIIDGIQSIIGERVTVVVSASAVESKEAAYLTEGWLQEHPDLDMIVAYNDAAALGAYQVAQASGRNDPEKFFIGGIDAIPAALAAIQQDGAYQATVNQPPEVMGIMVVRSLIAAIKGLPVKPVNTLYCAPVNRANAAEFSGTAREAAVLANQDIISAEALLGLNVSGLRLGLSVLTLANPFFAALADSAQKEAQRLGVELVVNDPCHVLGVLDVQSDQVNALTDDDRLLLEGLCGQIATAIESKRLIDNVQQSEQLLRTLLDTIPGHIYVKDLEGRIILANLAEAQLHGVETPDVLTGTSDFDFYPRELAEGYRASELPILRDGVPLINHEEPNMDATGRSFWSSTTKVPLRNNQGEIIGLVGMTTDITDRKQAEAERERLLREQERRTLQLQTASEVSRAASSLLNLDELLPQVAEVIRTRFNLYYVGIFLLDALGQQAALRAGTGEAGRQMLANAYRLEIGSHSMISECIVNREAQLALDVGEEAVRFDNPLLPLTRSEMALPLVSRGRVIGAMTIQSDQAAAFSADDITVLQSMADQISNAVENARLYEQAQSALADTDQLLQASAELNISQSYQDILNVIRKHTVLGQQALTVALNVFDRPWTENQLPVWIEVIGFYTQRTASIQAGARFPLAMFPSAKSLLRADGPTVIEDFDTAPVDPNLYGLFVKQFAAKSVIFVPLIVGGQWFGYCNILYAQVTHFDEADVQRLVATVGQVAVAVQNLRNLATAQQTLIETEASYRATQAIGRAETVENILQATTHVANLMGMTRVTLRIVSRRDVADMIMSTDIYEYRRNAEEWVLQPVAKDVPATDANALKTLQRNPEAVLIYADAQNSSSAMPDEVRQALLASQLRGFISTSVRWQNQVLGILSFSGPQALNEAAEQRLRIPTRTLSDQVAVALQNRLLFEQTRAALEEVDAINRRLTGETWNTYLQQHTNREVIWLTDDELAAPEVLSQLDDQLTAGEIIIEPDPEDATEATVTAPILLRGQPIGALRLRTPLSDWSEDSEALLTDIASHIAQAAENARLVEQTQRTAQRERMINEINTRVRQSVDLDAILRTAVNELGQSLKAARVMARVGTTAAEGSAATEGAATDGDGRGKTND